MILSAKMSQKYKENAIVHRRSLENLTRKASFFSLFIAENCLRRESIAGSSALSGATPFSQIQG